MQVNICAGQDSTSHIGAPMHSPRVLAPALLALLLALLTLPVAAQDQRCFVETGFCISGPIRTSWERNGGLGVFGFPISSQTQEMVEGRVLQVQWFERDRLEIQPDGSVTTGRLGVEYLARIGTPWQQGPGGAAGGGCAVYEKPAESPVRLRRG